MSFKHVGDAVYIIKFVVREEGVDFFNAWYNDSHLKWAADVFKCKYAARYEATHSAYETRTYFAIYYFDSREAMDAGLTRNADRSQLIEDLKKIRGFVTAEEFNPTYEILTYYPDT